MQLKLAEYNKDGKFKRFLELGKDFAYCGGFIIVAESKEIFEEPDYAAIELSFIAKHDLVKQLVASFYKAFYEFGQKTPYLLLKDKTDLLNRFNGLFNGRTYGEGRFVLVETPAKRLDELGTIQNFTVIKNDEMYFLYKDGAPIRFNLKAGWHWTIGYCGYIKEFENVGNLIENPELWEKIK